MRRYYPGYLHGLPGAGIMRRTLNTTDEAARVFALFEQWQTHGVEARDAAE
jgi:hypothetical protein